MRPEYLFVSLCDHIFHIYRRAAISHRIRQSQSLTLKNKLAVSQPVSVIIKVDDGSLIFTLYLLSLIHI